MFIYGVNPVKEALKVFKKDVKKVVISKSRKGKVLNEILELTNKYGVSLLYEKKEYLNRVSGTFAHQGIVGLIPEFKYANIDDIIEKWKISNEKSFILILDSINDPQNLGAIIRNAEIFGVNGIIIPKNRSASITPTVIKTSAGGVFHVSIARATNLASAIDYLKDNNIWIIGASPDAHNPIYSCELDIDISVVLGGEDKGIRDVIKKKCDLLLSIPIRGNISSLNVSSAGAIFLYEVLRQRMLSKKLKEMKET
jgi:23S rRNA (guanosine2251-2'-O)-methyltransferase